MNRKVTILLLGFGLFLGACLSLKQPPNKIDYYTLEYDSPRAVDSKPLDIVLGLKRFSVASTYNTNRIIYRDSSFKRNAYVYHKWWSNPGELVTQFLVRDMRRSGLFAAVIQGDNRTDSSYTLEGSVDEFLELDTEKTWRAVLSLTIVLVSDNDETGRRIVFQKTYNTHEECKHKNPRFLAEAMSGAMARTSAEIIKDVYGHLLAKLQ